MTHIDDHRPSSLSGHRWKRKQDMSCSSGHIARGKLVLQTGGRLVRLLRTCNLTRASGHRAFLSCAGQHVAHPSRSDPFSHRARILQDRRPNRWGCRLSTSCQVAASSPHAAVVETAEKKSSKQQNQLISLPTTDESPQLDRIRHSVSIDLAYCSCCSSYSNNFPQKGFLHTAE